jgi:cytidine deaminase
MAEQLSYTLPRRVEALIRAAVFARHNLHRSFPFIVRQALLTATLMKVDPLIVKVEIAKQLAIEAREWARNRPIKTSYRDYILGACVVTRSGHFWDAYNTKPLADIHGERNGGPKFRLCGEQLALYKANNHGDVNVEVIVLVGVHHDREGDLPEPCKACLRYFTALPNHRNIVVVMVHSDNGDMVQSTVGELVDKAELEQVECDCCNGST